MFSGKGGKHTHPSPKALKERAEVTEESPKERSAESITAEPVISPPIYRWRTPEQNESGSVISDDEGVIVSKEEWGNP